MPPPKDVAPDEFDQMVGLAEGLCRAHNVYTPGRANFIRRAALEQELEQNYGWTPAEVRRGIAHGIRAKTFRQVSNHLRINTVPLPKTMEKETAPLS